MSYAGETQRHADDDLYIDFVDRLDPPFGSVKIRAEQAGDRVICRAGWGGWSWRAEGSDRVSAHRRLNQRLSRLDPFDHGDSDWGPPGYQSGELDPAIPPTTRQRMREHTQREARSAVGLLDAVFEAQARRPWAFPQEGSPVPAGIEIEGYVAADGSLALFPRTFYEVANAYFGRGALEGAPRGNGARRDDLGSEYPSATGALRRLNEQGYMRVAEGRLPHQMQPIEVYVFSCRVVV